MPFTPGTTWYWQLDGTVKVDQPATVYDIDAQENTAALVAQLKGDGHTLVGYYSAGTWEAYRPDAAQFPASVIGHKLAGWDEKYLDIRSPLVRSLMAARMAMAKAKGFDAVEPDVMDAWQNSSGFPITEADQTDYALWTATTAHGLGLEVALKNVPELVPAVGNAFDFSIAEQAFSQGYYKALEPFITNGKAVLCAEYARRVHAPWCAAAKAAQMSLAFFNLDLNGNLFLPC